MMHPYYGPGSQLFQGGGQWWLGMISMAMYLIFWAIVTFAAFKLFKKYYAGVKLPTAPRDNALSILRERYAKGEIDADEFRQKKADLE